MKYIDLSYDIWYNMKLQMNGEKIMDYRLYLDLEDKTFKNITDKALELMDSKELLDNIKKKDEQKYKELK